MGTPWEKGIHQDYSAFVMEVHVRVENDGTVKSFRVLQSPEDAQTAAMIGTSHGMAEGSMALFVEAMRQECLVQMLSSLSANTCSPQDLGKDPVRVREKLERTVGDILKIQVEKYLPQIAQRVVDEIRREVT